MAKLGLLRLVADDAIQPVIPLYRILDHDPVTLSTTTFTPRGTLPTDTERVPRLLTSWADRVVVAAWLTAKPSLAITGAGVVRLK